LNRLDVIRSIRRINQKDFKDFKSQNYLLNQEKNPIEREGTEELLTSKKKSKEQIFVDKARFMDTQEYD